MKLTIFLTFLLIVSIHAEEDVYNGPSEEDVIVLDKDTLEATIYSS